MGRAMRSSATLPSEVTTGEPSRPRQAVWSRVVPLLLALFSGLLSVGILLFHDRFEGSSALSLWAVCALLGSAGNFWSLLRVGSRIRPALQLSAAFFGGLSIIVAAGVFPGSSTSVTVLVTSATLAIFLVHPSAPAREGPSGNGSSPIAASELSTAGIAFPWRDTRTFGGVNLRRLILSCGTALSAVLVLVAVTRPLGSLGARMATTAVLMSLTAAIAEAARKRRFSADSSTWHVSSTILLAINSVIALPALTLSIFEMALRIPMWGGPGPILPFVSPTAWIPVTVASLTVTLTIQILRAGQNLSALATLIAGSLLTAWTAGAVVPEPVISSLIFIATAVVAAAMSVALAGTATISIIGAAVCALSALLAAPTHSAIWFLIALAAALCCLTSLVPTRSGKRYQQVHLAGALSGACFTLIVLFTTHESVSDPQTLHSSDEAPAVVTTLTASILLIASGIRRWRHSSFLGLVAPITGGAMVLSIVGLLRADQTAPLTSVAVLSAALIVEAVSLVNAGAHSRLTVLLTSALIPPTSILIIVHAWHMTGRHVWGAPELLAVTLSVLLAYLGRRVSLLLARAHGIADARLARLLWNSTLALSCVITVPAAVTTGKFGAVHFALLALLPLFFTLPIAHPPFPIRFSLGTGSAVVLGWLSVYFAAERAASPPLVSSWLATVTCLTIVLTALSIRRQPPERGLRLIRVALGSLLCVIAMAPLVVWTFELHAPVPSLMLSGTALLCSALSHLIPVHTRMRPSSAYFGSTSVALSLAAAVLLTVSLLNGRLDNGAFALLAGILPAVSMTVAASTLSKTTLSTSRLKRVLASSGLIVFVLPQSFALSRSESPAWVAPTVAFLIAVHYLALRVLPLPDQAGRVLTALSAACLLASVVISESETAKVCTLILVSALALDGLLMILGDRALSSWTTLAPGLAAFLGAGTIFAAQRSDDHLAIALILVSALCLILGAHVRAPALRMLGALALAGNVPHVVASNVTGWQLPITAWPLLVLAAVLAGRHRQTVTGRIPPSDTRKLTEPRLG